MKFQIKRKNPRFFLDIILDNKSHTCSKTQRQGTHFIMNSNIQMNELIFIHCCFKPPNEFTAYKELHLQQIYIVKVINSNYSDLECNLFKFGFLLPDLVFCRYNVLFHVTGVARVLKQHVLKVFHTHKKYSVLKSEYLYPGDFYCLKSRAKKR